MNFKKSILFSFIILAVAACSKEQKQANELKGKWQITQFTMKDSSFVKDEIATQYFEFFACEKAYTATCQGIYTAETKDATIFTTIVDTFKYNLNTNDFTITKVKTNKARFLLVRCNIDKLENGNLEMSNDSVKVLAKKI